MALPERMRAVEIREPGPPEVLTLGERPVPAPGPGEVLVRVAAAGVNRPDCLQRRGAYPPPPGVTDIPGLEVAGVVAARAADVATPVVGERVCALVAGGGYAEYCTVPAVQCLPLPTGYSLVEAAALPEALFTVWTNVFERGGLQRGETLLVHGGASGIGTAAIALARALGARVFTTAGTAEKCALCERLGAERAVNYREARFADVVREATGGKGVDVILDMVGAPYLADNIALLREDGRLVLIAALGGSRAEINLAQVFMKRLTVTGSTLRNRSPAEKGLIARALRERVWPLLESRAVAPVIQATMPLAAAARAHEILEANATLGKIVLVVDEQA
jgi:putative PIG3 family NAD(P)H quinone oxidoreductase